MKALSLAFIMIGNSIFATALAASCGSPPDPNRPTPPVGSGGSAATGGSAGATAAGGSMATGGSAPVVKCPNFMPISLLARSKAAVPMVVTGWRRDPHRLDIIKAHAGKRGFDLAASGEATAYWRPNGSGPLNQLNNGSCTGDMAANCASTQPFKLVLTQADALAAYSAATKIDNGCAWNATECAGSFPPTDNGSYGSSALTAGVHLGWFKSWTAIPDVPTLIQRLQMGPCGIGLTWHEDTFTPGPDGKLSFGGRVAGGHEVMTNVFCSEFTPRRFYIDNSWGPWGLCIGSYCSYAYIEESQLVAMVKSGDAEIDCPDVP